MSSSPQRESHYIHGAAPKEQERLEALGKILGRAEFLPALKTGMRVLEVGCGTGSIARQVAARVAPGEVIGVDGQQVQLDTATRLSAEHGIGNLKFRRGDAAELDLPDCGFDGAYCRFLLEHVMNPFDVVREMARVVRPGGWVCACEWENGCDVVYPASPAVEKVWQALYDLQRAMGGDAFVARKLYQILTEAELSSVKVDALAWTIAAHEKERLLTYTDGAREIIGQGRERLLAEKSVTSELLEQAEAEYARLLDDPATFVMGACICATGTKAGGDG